MIFCSCSCTDLHQIIQSPWGVHLHPWLGVQLWNRNKLDEQDNVFFLLADISWQPDSTGWLLDSGYLTLESTNLALRVLTNLLEKNFTTSLMKKNQWLKMLVQEHLWQGAFELNNPESNVGQRLYPTFDSGVFYPKPLPPKPQQCNGQFFLWGHH